MAKGKRYSNKIPSSSSKKKNSVSQQNDCSSSEGMNSSNNSQKNNGTNYNFTITVYKQSNGQYSLYDNSTLISNNINNFSKFQNPNIIISNNNNDIGIGNETVKKKLMNYKDNHPVNYSLSFKNKNFESKIRARTEKNYRNSKNMKNLGKEGKDAISYKIYCDLEAGPSLLPKKKYCDFTGLTSCYNELHTGIRYYNSQIYKISQNIPQPIKDQYLNIRKALIRLK